MLAYNNDPALKAALLDQIRKHREMDQIVQGTYGDGDNENWCGCAIACSLRSLDIVRGNDVATRYYAHPRYPAELGIPLELAYLKDRIFENLPIRIARRWPERFAAAIEPGADLSGVWPQFALWLLIDPVHGVQRYTKTKESKAIKRVASLYQRWLDGNEPSADEWSAVNYIVCAADVYAVVNYADNADRAARYATAGIAADITADYTKHFELMSDKLVELLGNTL